MIRFNFFLPENVRFRASLMLILIIIETQYLLYEEGEITDAGLSEITSLDEIQVFIITIREALEDSEAEFTMEASDIMKFYAFAIIVNKLLVSDLDEMVIASFKEKLPPEYNLPDFNLTRKVIIICNNMIIEAIKEQSHLLYGFEEMNNWLADLEV
jgi:hypothetical protein